jgi:hypothetical protein
MDISRDKIKLYPHKEIMSIKSLEDTCILSIAIIRISIIPNAAFPLLAQPLGAADHWGARRKAPMRPRSNEFVNGGGHARRIDIAMKEHDFASTMREGRLQAAAVLCSQAADAVKSCAACWRRVTIAVQHITKRGRPELASLVIYAFPVHFSRWCLAMVLMTVKAAK